MSIRDHGFRVMELRTLDFDMEDIRERQAKPDVIELAKSRQRIALHPITVDAKNKRLIAGRDRLAADLLNKVSRAPVRLIEGTDEEMQDVEDEENLRRRHENRDELIAAYVARKSAKLKEAAPELLDKIPNNSPKAGRPKLAETKIREELAEKLSVTPDAIRKSEARAKVRPQSKESEGAGDADNRLAPTPAPSAPPPIALKGKSATPEFLDKIREVQRAIDVADKALRAAQGALSKLEALPFPRAVLQNIHAAAHALAADVRAMRPRSLCTAAHGKAPCILCGGAGWLGSDADTIQEASGTPTPATTSAGNQRAQPRTAPSSVNSGAAAGASNGTGKGAAEVATKAVTSPPKNTAAASKKVQILDENDKPIAVIEEDDEDF